ncbi:Putative mannose-1-phosphate guanylyltransferase [Vibrio harveyi]|uniref:nucleotidyltransferase family protein n=1 Tax=Vibrio harveyi TaxID=669 RepID=UPI002AD9B329|nr:nucleotidyltransferase family protein [Vibrio harveyi]CAK6712080.1 Putative mannose-1-phosphate guanylyltransferase [Vibrio harveyi]
MITLEKKSIKHINDIVSVLNNGGHGYVAIVDDKKLVGLVTDGDLRRCILEDDLKVDNIINFNPKTSLNSEPRDSIIRELNEKQIKQMLIVDRDNILVDVIRIDENVFSKHNNKVVIMAGGLGSRLGELTKVTPKPMLHVGGKPIILHIIERFRDFGFRKFIISTNYKKEVIQEFLKDGYDFGVNIEYVEEEKRLGTAGALSLMKDKLDVPFFVTNADVISLVDFPDLLMSHLNFNCIATMCVRNCEYTVPYGVVESNCQGIIKGIVEKPSYSFNINAGVYVLDPKVLEYVPDDTYYDMPSLFNDLNTNNHLVKKYDIHNYWIDIGNPDDYQLANEQVSGDLK